MVSKRKASGIYLPIQLTQTINGFRIKPRNHRINNGYLDCRLAAAMVRWVEILSAYGFTAVEYASIYRRNARVGGSSKVSGHAHGLAVDIRSFTLGEHRIVDVKDDWIERERGGDPCAMQYDEPVPAQLMRRAVCEAGARKLFQVILTPHYDRAHADHIHLEVVPNVNWDYIR